MQVSEPSTVVEYVDPIEGFKGWLVIDGTEHEMCAGGMRVHPALTVDNLKSMARNMTRKMRVWGLPINGAKSGLAYDPHSPGLEAAIRRFMKAIKPFMLTSYSMGADLNTRMDLLERLAKDVGIPSIKMAIARAQGMTLPEFESRYALLNRPAVGDWTLGSLRAGWGVGMAALAVLDNLGVETTSATAAVQGFGTLAKASILALKEAGVRIVALADAEKCVFDTSGEGLDVASLLSSKGTLIPALPAGAAVRIAERDAVLAAECDVVMLEAIENVVTAQNYDRIRARSVVSGANLAVTDEAERLLHRRGVVVVPCFVAGGAAPLSMNGLFGPTDAPGPREVLDFLKSSMDRMVGGLIATSRSERITLGEAGMRIVTSGVAGQRIKPYAV